MSLLQHAAFSLRRNKKDTISLTVLIFLAVMLLAAGLSIQVSMNDFYYQSNERLHAPHYSVSIPNNSYQVSYLEYLQNDPRVSEAEARETAFMYGASYEVNGGKNILYANFFSTEDGASIAPFTLLEESGDNIENGIYVPCFFKNNGYQYGDDVTFDYNGEIFIYHVAGYFETTWYGSSVNSVMTFYLPEAVYQNLYRQIGGGKMLSVRVRDIADTEALRQDFREDTGLLIESAGSTVSSIDSTFQEMQSVAVIIPNVAASIMMGFAVIVFLIILLVIRFRVYSYMEDNLKNIGVLEAIGHTVGQIRRMIMLEYLIITAAGSVTGILASYGLIKLLGSFISGFTGTRWDSRFYPGVNLFCLMLIMVLVALTTGLYSRKIKKLTPVTALRGGIASHSFRKNHFSFGKYNFPLQLQLACQGMAANYKQYLMVSAILLGVTATAAFSMMLYSNMSGEDSALYKAIGMESSNVSVEMAAHQDLAGFRDEVLEMEEVRKTSTYAGTTCDVEGKNESFYISDDFSKLETVMVYAGSFPHHDNEVVITGTMAGKLHKNIGDTIEIGYLGVKAGYIICGLTQTMNNLGSLGLLSEEGIRRINPSFTITGFNVYLKDGYDTGSFITRLEQDYGVLSPEHKADTGKMTPEQRVKYRAEERITKLLSMYGVDSADYSLSLNGEVILSGTTNAYRIKQIDNMELFITTSIGKFVAMAAILVFGVLAATLFIVGLILVLVIRYMVLRRRHEFGMMKAIGYTSTQIRKQIALGFLPFTAVGIAAGGMLAGLTLNPVLNVLLAPIGISRMPFDGKPLLVAGLSAALMLYVYLIAFLASGKIKAITAYELFVD